MDPHFHALVLDGVYTGLDDTGDVVFHPLPKPSDQDIEKLVRSLHGRVLGLLRRRGVLEDEEYEELTSLGLCQVAAVQGRIPFGEGAGNYDKRIGRDRASTSPKTRRRLCADHRGFSLHADTRVGAGKRDRLERLAQYILRPAISEKRLSVTPTGKVRYAFKSREFPLETGAEWRDGSSAVEICADDLSLASGSLGPNAACEPGHLSR